MPSPRSTQRSAATVDPSGPGLYRLEVNGASTAPCKSMHFRNGAHDLFSVFGGNRNRDSDVSKDRAHWSQIQDKLTSRYPGALPKVT